MVTDSPLPRCVVQLSMGVWAIFNSFRRTRFCFFIFNLSFPVATMFVVFTRGTSMAQDTTWFVRGLPCVLMSGDIFILHEGPGLAGSLLSLIGIFWPGSPCLAGASLFVEACMPWPGSPCLAGVSFILSYAVARPGSLAGVSLFFLAIFCSAAEVFTEIKCSIDISFLLSLDVD